MALFYINAKNFIPVCPSDLVSVAVADSSPGSTPPPVSSSIRPDPISAMSSAVSSRSRLTSGAMTPPAALLACCQGWKKPGSFKKTQPSGFFGFFVFFLGFLVFLYIVEERVLGFFQFQEYF